MCGICGKLSFGVNTEDLDEALIRKMNETLRHRGPDDEGVYVSKIKNQKSKIKIGLGHRRLSIIDLSPAGHQPMCNEDGTIWLVMNGEIYNFLELRQNLEKKGHIFKSHTDTEVVLHLYEERGIDCVKELRGMFAFAIWDGSKRSRLFLARDRVGKKPIFYAIKNGGLVFASELNALLQDRDISREIDLDSIDDFLNYQYIPAPYTIFQEVRKLSPAHYLIWENGEVKIEKYWQIDYSKKLNLKENEYCERILDLLKEATKIRLISDVPLGAFLSGGIDSSAIVAVMSRQMDRPVKTFSIGFEDRSFDETEYARTVSEIFSTDHREFIVKPNALEVLPDLILHFGEPFGDPSAIPTYYLCKMTRQEVTVALNGDGGDESFGGYERYVAMKLSERFRIPLFILSRILMNFIKDVPESTDKKDKSRRFKKFLEIAGLDRKTRYSNIMSILNKEFRQSIYSEAFINGLRHNFREDIIFKTFGESKLEDLIDSTLFVDIMTYLPGDLLPKVDITSMANSLEARSPFLDHKFMEFSAGIPPKFKVKGTTTKYILKKALEGLLPDRILKREKMGFGVPIGSWFRRELNNYAYEVLLSPKAIKRSYFKKEGIKEILDNHTRGKVDNGHRIWCLLILELWHRMFIDKEQI